MTLQSNFSCTTCLNISAVQESPSRHISSSLPEVKLLQKKKRKGENPTILQFDLITTSNTCSMKYFSTLFIPEQKMLKNNHTSKIKICTSTHKDCSKD